MSSRSPRGSISGAASSAEVAADFEDALKDLQANNRYEISNLTIIAKENTEHAQAISRVLENHIKTTPASRKLPAFYVLDSIVKNVGTPYTVYLGRELYKTFMEAYTLVDGTTRKAMEGLMKTWKEPVPGSIDPRPVFPIETVRPIENALIKARTAVLQSRQPQMPYRANVPTPPQHNGQFATPPMHNLQHYMAYNSQQPTPQQQPQHGFQPPPPPQSASNDVDGVKRDIQSLIPRFQQMLATNPGDTRARQQMDALQALLTLLQNRALSPTEFQAVRTQVTTLSAALPPHRPAQPAHQPTVPTPQWQLPVPMPYPQTYQPPPQHHSTAPIPFSTANPVPPPSNAAPPLLDPNALSGLQALLASVQKPSTPQMRAAVPEMRNATHSQLHSIQNHAATPATSDATDLLAALSKAGIINTNPPTSVSVPPPTLPAAAPTPNVDILKSLQSITPSTQGRNPSQPSIGNLVQPLSAATLRIPRPELIHALYDAQPNQCTQCGRRFLATEEGRENKNRHLDWHFRTNQRIADPNTNRGHHRDWFVDEMKWVKHVEFDPSTTTAAATDAAAAAKTKNEPQQKSVRAPAGMTKNTCNICQEDMNSQYSDELQDWIFANASVQNGQIVHATCLAEMTKPALTTSSAGSLAAVLASVGAGSRERSATPDSLKRKAETVMDGGGQRVRIS